jgi:nicotinamide mononucleotide transporter
MNYLVQYFTQTPYLELCAVFFALVYVILAAQVNKWCWPAAFISTLLYSYIFYDVTLFMDSLLNVYYLVMAIYGWWLWQNKANHKNNAQPLTIESFSLSQHFYIVLALALLSLLFGWFMANYTRASFAYADSATTVFAVYATYLVAKRILENWLYWIIIDAVSIYLYVAKGLYSTAMLFAVYVIIAIWGYYKWRAQYHQQINMQNNENLSVETVS